MANDPCLGMLGLARRAGKLAYGDELVRQLCADHKARCVLVAADAGESTAKKASFYAARVKVPCITLPHSKDELGAAIGKNGCAVCAVSDIGLAAAAIGKLAAQHPEYAEVAAQLNEKNTRIQSRRGKKKPRDREAQPAAEQSAEKPSRKPNGSRPQRAGASSRPTSPRNANGKRPHGIGSRFASERKPSKNPRAKRV
ncbi:MAG TPA: ribosomal L7Ae/L30e/S12e/Gadd45 family protein [Candidatus Agathobaculum merdavium]|nr:ribosomal L7Ae/L30e/S12e/Gadd45 family protein [Candidatus Agathobaculum merdavium]